MAMKRSMMPLAMLAAGLGLGLLSGNYMLQITNTATPVGSSGWNELRIDGDDLRSTYMTGHFLVQGQVPPPKGARFLTRSVDDDGQSLRGDCVVSVEGKIPAGRWWFVGAESGRLRNTIDASQAVRETSGDVSIAVSTSPTPGNWLVPPNGGSYELQLVLLGVDNTEPLAAGLLPRVRRLWC
jgi:hypothetical protein